MPIRNPDILRDIPLFQNFDADECSALAAQMDSLNYLAGQVIFTTGEDGGTMLVVESGKVELYVHDNDGKKVVLETLLPGAFFGELSLLDNHQRSASARALENTHLLVVDRNDLQYMIRNHPDSVLDMMAILGERLRMANLIVRDRVTRNVNAEIAPTLTWGDRLSDGLTAIAGDIRFVYFSATWFVTWIVLNTEVIPGLEPFDPFPFGLLTMIVSLEAIFLSLFVLISQNRQTERDHIRNEIEYEVNLKAELEIRELSQQLDQMQQLMLSHFSAINQQRTPPAE